MNFTNKSNEKTNEQIDSELEKINNRIIEQISENMESYGHTRSMGHIIAAIYYEEKPMGLEELAETTGMSKTRMSQLLRKMLQLNIAEKVYVKGSRRDIYTVEEDYYQTFISLFTSNWRDVVTRNRKIDQSILKKADNIKKNKTLSKDQQHKVNHLLEDTYESIEFFNWVSRLIELFESQEIFKYLPKDMSRKDKY